MGGIYGRRLTDSEIKQQVLRELKWDSRIAWAQIGVDVGDGVVTLSGVVNTYGKKSTAQQAAHRLAGVLDVANDIDVRPIGAFARTDAEIASAFVLRFQMDGSHSKATLMSGARAKTLKRRC